MATLPHDTRHPPSPEEPDAGLPAPQPVEPDDGTTVPAEDRQDGPPDPET